MALYSTKKKVAVVDSRRPLNYAEKRQIAKLVKQGRKRGWFVSKRRKA